MSEPAASQSARASSVLMGRQDFVSVLLRLIGMELYKLRRRMMSKVLSSISIVATLCLFGLIALVAFLMTRNGTSALIITNFSAGLRLPASLSLVGQLILSLGEILMIILVSTIVGGEYTDKTVRLMLTRGPTRTQFVLAKVGAALVCCAIGASVMIVLGIPLGLFFNLFTGLPFTLDFFTPAWLSHALLYILITIFSLFVYSMLALFLATLGRSTAAGIAGALTWLLLGEAILRTILDFIGTATGGTTGDILRSVPDYFIGSNTGALLQNQNQYLGFFGASSLSSPSSISNLHAILVLLGYVVAFIGLSLWLNQKRDITN